MNGLGQSDGLNIKKTSQIIKQTKRGGAVDHRPPFLCLAHSKAELAVAAALSASASDPMASAPPRICGAWVSSRSPSRSGLAKPSPRLAEDGTPYPCD